MNTKKDFDEHIRMFFGPVTETATYAERIGPPEELPAVIGLISMKFSQLEDTLSQTIIKMLQLDNERGQIMTAELSFRVKVAIFSALYQNLKDKYFFNTFPDFDDEYFKELIKALNKCEAQRNQIMHSTFAQNYLTNSKIMRKKVTAKQKDGLKIIVEETDIIKLFNIADLIGGVEFELDQFGIGIMTEKNRRYKFKPRRQVVSPMKLYRLSTFSA